MAVVLLFAQSMLPVAVAANPPSLLQTDHALANRIWDSKNRKWVSVDDVVRVAAGATHVLLGETHDNPVHHANQLTLLDALTRAGKKPALMMEQFDVEHQDAIDNARRALKQDATLTGEERRKFLHEAADAIATAGKLNRTGWKWPQYQPLVETAVNLNLPVIAANLSRTAARDVFRQGLAAAPVTADETFWRDTWNAAREAEVRATMKAGHCGQLPESMAPGMVNAQRARDAVMAKALAAHATRGTVFIAGRGHVRRDVGVPLYLLRNAPNERMVVVGLVEVAADKTKPEDYAELQSAIELPFDYVWFTARQDRPDPCAGLSLDKLSAPAK